MAPERVSGKRSNNTYFIEGGFMYKTRSSTNGTKYLICVEDFCVGKAVLSNNRFNITSHHVHEPDKVREEEVRYIHGIRTMAKNSETGSIPFRTISDHQSSLYPLGSLQRGFYADRMIMYRSRREVIPPLPHTFEEVLITLSIDDKWKDLGLSLHTHEKFFIDIAHAFDRSEAVLFLSPFFKELFLQDSVSLFVDSTFDSRPLNPPSAQLLTIHVVEHFMGNNYIYPAAYALMESKSADCYVAVFELINSALGRHMNVVSAMCDYELGLQVALKRLFPDIDLSGCWFHFCNAVFLKALQLQLINLQYEANPLTQRMLNKCLALPLLPPASIGDGLTVIECELQNLGLQHSFSPLISYLRTTWFEDTGFGVDVVSVFELGERTNNTVESAHYQLFRKIGQVRPNFWDFVLGLRRFDYARHQDRERILKGVRVQPPLKQKYARQERNIKDMQQKLVEGQLNIASFLDRACHTVEGLQKRRMKVVDNVEVQM